MSGCNELAAELYAERYHFHECLYACSEGKLFELGLQYIRSWKKDDHFRELVKVPIDLNACEQEFLLKCAHASHTKDDNEKMKFVEDFSSLESMREFLKKSGRFDELLKLELNHKSILEAAKCARLIGNILLEANFRKGWLF